jgi:hypothetical protein
MCWTTGARSAEDALAEGAVGEGEGEGDDADAGEGVSYGHGDEVVEQGLLPGHSRAQDYAHRQDE